VVAFVIKSKDPAPPKLREQPRFFSLSQAQVGQSTPNGPSEVRARWWPGIVPQDDKSVARK